MGLTKENRTPTKGQILEFILFFLNLFQKTTFAHLKIVYRTRLSLYDCFNNMIYTF